MANNKIKEEILLFENYCGFFGIIGFSRSFGLQVTKAQ